MRKNSTAHVPQWRNFSKKYEQKSYFQSPPWPKNAPVTARDAPLAEASAKRKTSRLILIAAFGVLSVLSVLICTGIGSVKISISDVAKALFVDDGSMARLLVWNLRFPRVLVSGLVGICLSLSGCILQGVMRNTMASPSTIGVTLSLIHI